MAWTGHFTLLTDSLFLTTTTAVHPPRQIVLTIFQNTWYLDSQILERHTEMDDQNHLVGDGAPHGPASSHSCGQTTTNAQTRHENAFFGSDDDYRSESRDCRRCEVSVAILVTARRPE